MSDSEKFVPSISQEEYLRRAKQYVIDKHNEALQEIKNQEYINVLGCIPQEGDVFYFTDGKIFKI